MPEILCKKCGIRPRYGKHGNCDYCIECANENHNEYNREWRKRNPDYQKEWKAKFKKRYGVSYAVRRAR